MRARTPTIPKSNIGLRLPDTEVARIKALMPLYTTRGHEATLSDVLREAFLIGLSDLEKQAADPDSELRRRFER